MAKYNKLSNEQTFRLYEWMKERADEFTIARWHNYEIAEMAAEELGFGITDANVQGGRQALGLHWIARPLALAIPAPIQPPPANDNMAILAAHIVVLFERMLWTVSPELKAMAEGAK